MTQPKHGGPGVYLCNACEEQGKGPGERFRVRADDDGLKIMVDHLKVVHRIEPS